MGIILYINSGQSKCETITTSFDEMEITIDEGGEFALTIAAATHAQQSITATLARNSKLHLTTIDLNSSGLVRQTNIELAGEGSECYLSGVFIATGDERVENHTSIRHTAAHCHSEQKFHGIVADHSVGLFDGKIYVAQGAQQTVALQENHNICLSDRAKVFTRPQLEIYADDVKCNHGATIGRRDEQAIFYMRQRGLTEAAAQALLLESFAFAPLNERIDPAISDSISQIIHSL